LSECRVEQGRQRENQGEYFTGLRAEAGTSLVAGGFDPAQGFGRGWTISNIRNDFFHEK